MEDVAGLIELFGNEANEDEPDGKEENEFAKTADNEADEEPKPFHVAFLRTRCDCS